METKKQNFNTEKNNGCKINGEKKENQKGGKNGKTWTCPFAFLWHLLCFFFDLFVFFYSHFFPGKKRNKYKIKAKTNKSRKQYKRKTNANGQVMCVCPF